MKYGYRGTTTWIEHPGGWCEYYDRRLTLDEIKQEWERMQPVRHRFTPGEQLFGRKVPLDAKPTRRCDPERLCTLAQMTAKEHKEEVTAQWHKLVLAGQVPPEKPAQNNKTNQKKNGKEWGAK